MVRSVLATFGPVFGAIACSVAVPLPVVAQRPPPIVAPGGSEADKQRLLELRTLAVGEDRVAALKAMQDMKSMAAIGKPTLIDSLRVVLLRDKTLLEQAARKATLPGADLAKLEADAGQQRQASLAHIAELSKKPDTRAARASYQKLRTAVTRLTEGYDARATLIDVMRYRSAFVALWSEVDPKVGPKVTDSATETTLAATVEKALTPTLLPILRDLQSRPDAVADPEASSPEQKGFLQFRMRRRIDVYNRSLATQADPAELELTRMINAYRDALDLPALEMDLRLMQAARRHSKEMSDLKYFSSTSPTEATRDAVTRLKAAGFEPAGAWSEALARNTKTATETFWGMFDTPHYHQAMTSAEMTAIGVGRWSGQWTINLATGQRLMLATHDQRAAAGVQGESVPPQSEMLASESPRRGDGQNDRSNDPTKIRPMIPGGAGSVPSIPSLPGF